jgi:arylsulfatase A-like enzyme
MPDARPNLLLFIADGMQAQVLDPGHPCVLPNLRRLMAAGVTVTRAYTTLPTCSPARASLMTGLLPHNHGMVTVEHCVAPDQSVLRRDRPHFAQRLRESGYRTAYFGKWHIERSLELGYFGWEHDASASGQHHRRSSERGMAAEAPLLPGLHHYLRGPAGYRDTLHYGVTSQPLAERPLTRTTAAAAAWLAQPPAEPWCACVSYFEPNEAMIATAECFRLYDPAALPLPASLRDPLAGQPGLYRREQRIFADYTDEQWRLALACYYARCTEMDRQLGTLLAALAASGQAARTTILVTADHGKYVGAHGFDAHNVGAFEEIYRVPLVVAGPGLAAGATVAARVGLHDLCPTLLELAGLPPLPGADSRSCLPLLQAPADHAAAWQHGFAEYHGTRFPLCQRIVWDGPWKFVFNGFDFDELYHLDDDPAELRNLAADPAYAATLRRLTARLWYHLQITGDATLLNTHYYSMRLATVGPEAAAW